MNRPITLFTGQWADIPLATLAAMAADWGYDGLELACWGDHFDPVRASRSKSYCEDRHALLARHNLKCWSISHHLAGQLVCDTIDERHYAFLPDGVGRNPKAAKAWAVKTMKQTAKAAANMGLKVVNGFTGSSIWPLLYSFPPCLPGQIEAGYRYFAKQWLPILDEFERQGVRFALEVHPTEIAFDSVSAAAALEAVHGHPAFGFNYDPSHLGYQGVDYIDFIRRFAERIFHVHMKDVWWGRGDGTAGVFGGHTNFGDARRYWDFRSLGHGDIRFEDMIVALNDIGYRGPLSVEWEDSRMDRCHGAQEACAFARRVDYPSSTVAFDAQFDK
jgi:sugar phosphate isomerase/epimerase